MNIHKFIFGSILLFGVILGAVSAFAFEMRQEQELKTKPLPDLSVRPKLLPKHIKSQTSFEPEFFVEERAKDLKYKNCQQCHLEGLKKHDVKAWDLSPHGDMGLKHAEFMDCQTCHAINDSNQLKLINEEKVSFNHSYLVCAQCHQQEFEDWQGGAHGKRLFNWSGKRVIKNCTACHEAHHPAIKARYPVLFPQIPRK